MAPGPVVFLILSHRRPRQIERLAERLTHTRSAITAVHHDAKSAERPVFPDGGRTVLVPEPKTVEWGRFSQVEAILHGMRWIRSAIPDFSWIVLISGEDYPAMSPIAIEAE